MPQMGVSVAEGTVVEWKKQPGDWVEADEIIASISTDKIDTDVEAPGTGRVQELLVEVGTTVEVGTVLARIATDAKPGEAHRSEAIRPRRNPRQRIPPRNRRQPIPPRRRARARRRRRSTRPARPASSRATPSRSTPAQRSAAPPRHGGPGPAATRRW